MSEPKFTKGGWNRNVKPASHYPVIFAGRNTHVAVVSRQGLTEEEIEANCDLIASAPKLYCALFDVLDAIGALGGKAYELEGYGFSEQRAKEIVGVLEQARGEV